MSDQRFVFSVSRWLFIVHMSAPKTDVECILRCVVRDGPQLEAVVRHLTEMFGQGEEIDVFHERLVFVPHNEAGNLNVIHRESLIGIEYPAEKDTCTMKYYGAPVNIMGESGGVMVEAYTVTEVAATTNIRRTMLKTGFKVKADYAEKGLRFHTRRESQVVSITRPYNASLIEERLYKECTASWDSLPGSFPFGRDYLFEIRQYVGSTQTPDEVVAEARALVNRLIT